MSSIKRKIQSRIKRIFFGNIMKKSQNYLPLTHREKAMVKWFMKFQAAMILVIISLAIPFQALYAVLSETKLELNEISSPVAITSPEPKSEEISLYGIKSETIREVTMYNSLPEQTDDTPCISADGTNICELDYNVCATNAFPFGTVLYVDKLGECVVHDRMNKRYKERIDWYAKMDLQRALNFGIQNLAVMEVK